MKFLKRYDHNEHCICVNGFRIAKKNIVFDKEIHDRFIFTQEGNAIYVEDLMNETYEKIGTL